MRAEQFVCDPWIIDENISHFKVFCWYSQRFFIDVGNECDHWFKASWMHLKNNGIPLFSNWKLVFCMKNSARWWSLNWKGVFKIALNFYGKFFRIMFFTVLEMEYTKDVYNRNNKIESKWKTWGYARAGFASFLQNEK